MNLATSKHYSKFNSTAFLIPAGLLLLFSVVLYRTAWISDDAYISYRVVDNLLNGLGPNYNPGERVQVFTHPLWFLVHIPFALLIDDAYWIGLLLSFAFSLAVLILLFQSVGWNPNRLVFITICLIMSASVIDYSSSGLENPLGHFLFIALGIQLTRSESGKWMFLTMGLIALTRLDYLLLLFPIIVFQLRNDFKGNFGPFVLGFMPVLAWMIFSLFYYGFLFPMTAYAKLNVAIPRAALLAQGLQYFLHSLVHDPLSITLILITLGSMAWIRDKSLRAMQVGMILYISYIVWIGGDFMSGRFLSTLVVLSVFMLSRFALPSHIVVPGLVVLGMIGSNPPLLSNPSVGSSLHGDLAKPNEGITDERAYYFTGTGLLTKTDFGERTHAFVQEGLQLSNQGKGVYISGNLGMKAYYAGPEVYFVDRYALANPFLAFLPNSYQPNWRPGHFHRFFPKGYIESEFQGKNLVENLELKEWYEKVHVLTRAPLLSTKRLKLIADVNILGAGLKWAMISGYYFPIHSKVRWNDFKTNEDGYFISSEKGLEIRMDEMKDSKIELSVDPKGEYVLTFLEGDQIKLSRIVPRDELIPEGVKKIELELPDEEISRLLIHTNTPMKDLKISF